MSVLGQERARQDVAVRVPHDLGSVDTVATAGRATGRGPSYLTPPPLHLPSAIPLRNPPCAEFRFRFVVPGVLISIVKISKVRPARAGNRPRPRTGVLLA